MKKHRLLLLSVFLMAVFSLFGQGYKIAVKIDGIKDTNLLLGHHFGPKKYVVDTIKVDKKGVGMFKADTLLPGGIYLVILPNLTYFEILLDKDQDFALETKSDDLLKNLKFKGSDDNTLFLAYQNFMIVKQTKAQNLRNRYQIHAKAKDSVGLSPNMKAISKDSVEIIKKLLEVIDEEVKKEWNRIKTDYKGSLLASMLNAMTELDIPDAPKDANGKVTDSLFQYRYYRKHYFDNVNFTDERLLRTPILESRIESYFKLPVFQIPDSVIPAADWIIAKTVKNKKMYQYALQYFFNKYNGSEIIGQDKIFVHIAKKYYLSGKAWWTAKDKDFMDKLYDRVTKMESNLIGLVAPNLRLQDIKENKINLHDIKADYLVLYFYDPDCGHCKKVIPEWHEIYQKLDQTKIKTVYVTTKHDEKEWPKFIEEHKLGNCLNLTDKYNTTNFRILYDIYSTPVSYILDKDKKIIMKRIGPTTIEDFLKRVMEDDAKKKK